MRKLTYVESPMDIKLFLLGETFTALQARERALVDLLVRREFFFVTETLAAFRAVETRVSLSVFVESRFESEQLPALQARIGTLASVNALVVRQSFLSRETFPAHQTGEGTLARVASLVIVKVGLVSEAHPALRTRMKALTGVKPLVRQ